MRISSCAREGQEYHMTTGTPMPTRTREQGGAMDRGQSLDGDHLDLCFRRVSVMMLEKPPGAFFLALSLPGGSRAVPHATAYDAVHDAFMTLPPYTRIKEGEVHSRGRGVRNGSRSARSDPLSEPSGSIEREGPATSARSGSGLAHPVGLGM